MDRDGTILEDTHYLADPADARLIDGAALAVTRLRAAGFVIVVVTNQSGIARGLITQSAYEAVRTRIDNLLASSGAAVDATYMCPHHPDFTGPCDCRKPGIGLFRRAARELDLDLTRSVLVGDRWRDIAGAVALGARAILVPSAETPPEEVERAGREAAVEPTLDAAVDLILHCRS